MNLNLLFFVFLSVCLVGFYLAYLYGRKTWRFHWGEYIAIIILPILCLVYLSVFYDLRILTLFLISSFLGFFLEYVIGLTYHKTLNRRLWKYHKYSVGGYTSLLSLPLWGIGGVVFWLLGSALGL